MPIGSSDEGIFLNWDSIFLDDCTLCQVKKSISTLFPIQAQRLCVDSGRVMVENLITIKFVSHIVPTMHMFLGQTRDYILQRSWDGWVQETSLFSLPLSSPPLPFYFFPSSFIFIWGWTFWIVCHEILPFLLTASEEFWLVSPLCYSLITVGNRGVSDVFILPS